MKKQAQQKTLSDKVFNLNANFTVKSGFEDDEDSVTIEGYANTTNKDRDGDIILQEAWTKGGLDNYLKNPIVLAHHKLDEPIGEVVDYNITEKGLYVAAEITRAAGEKMYNLIKRNILKAFSIGFRVKDADYDSEKDLFVIKDLELYELSVVSIPSNAESIFSVRKSFEDEKDFDDYKHLFIEDQEVEKETTDLNKGEQDVDKDKVSLTPEELEIEKAKAVEAALAEREAKKAKEEEIKNMAVTAGQTGAERLVKEFEERMAATDEENSKTLNAALEGLRSELHEKTKELENLTKSKMSFENSGSRSVITPKEIDTAVMVGKILGKDIDKTKYGSELITKAGDHLGGMATPDDWETLFSTRLYDDIMHKTVIEPLFTNRIPMTSRTMYFPWNPDAGYAEWVPDTQYKSSAGDNPNSTGAAAGQTHLIKDNLLKAEKLAAKEFLGYEEEEDAILPLASIIRDAVMRRMVRSTDTELLRGNIAADLGSGDGLINGVATLADDAAAEVQQAGSFGSTNPVTVADLQATRRAMGSYGLLPGEIVYLVSQSVYFDLLEDPDFRTMDLVGSNATILRGQIGTINGSPVIISDSFVANAAGTIQAAVLYASNYLLGELRGMTVERDRDIINQKNVLIATRRFAFTEIVPAGSSGNANAVSSCAVLKAALA
mgnify:FL=1